MDLPATQAIDEDDFVATQSYPANDDDEEILVATLRVDDVLHSVYSGTTTIGRSPVNKIVINDETVSKIHAEIEAESASRAIFIKDLGSSNKTRINKSKLKPRLAYQIKDKDQLTFGKVIATFKVYKTMEDSFVDAPQENKNKSIIPDTPDASMNASASESDLSAIPGTQADVDSPFRRPKIPAQNTDQNSPGIAVFSASDLPSPLAADKKNLSSDKAETRRYSTSDTKEMIDSSSMNSTHNSTRAQKAFTVEQSETAEEEDIFEMETQRPDNLNDTKDDLENLATQPFESRKSDSARKSMHNDSICSAETRKVKGEVDKSISNLETSRSRKSLSAKLNDVSIYSAKTQKAALEDSEDVETQSHEKVVQGKRQSVTLHSHGEELKEIIPEESFDDVLEGLETQSFKKSGYSSTPNVPKKRSSQSSATKLVSAMMLDASVEDMETQRFEDEVSNNSGTPNVPTRKSNSKSATIPKVEKSIQDVSMQDAETKELEKLNNFKTPTRPIRSNSTTSTVPKRVPEASVDDMETQRFEDMKSEDLETSSSSTKKSGDKSLITSEDKESDVSIEDAETQQFEEETTPVRPTRKSLRTPKVQQPILEAPVEDVETQRFEDVKSGDLSISTRKSSVESLKTPEKDKNSADSIEDVETQKIQEEATPSRPIRKSLRTPKVQQPTLEAPVEDVETQRFEKQETDESRSPNVSLRKSSSKSLQTFKDEKSDDSIEDAETQQFEEETTPIKPTRKSLRTPKSQQATLEASIEDVETQQFENKESGEFKAPNTLARKSNIKSLYTPKLDNVVSDEPIEEAETQQFEETKPNNFRTPTPSTRKSLRTPKASKPVTEDMETQRFEDETPRRPSRRSSMNTPQVQRNAPLAVADETLGDLETQRFEEKSNISCRKSNVESTKDADTKKLVTEETMEDLETQPFVSDKSMKFIDETIDDLEPQSFVSRKSMRRTLGFVKTCNESTSQNNHESRVSKSLGCIESKKWVDRKSSGKLDKSAKKSISGSFSADQENNETSTVEQNHETNDIPTEEKEERQTPNKISKSAVGDLKNQKQDRTLSDDDAESNVSRKDEDVRKEPTAMEEEEEEDEIFCSQSIFDDVPIEYVPEKPDEEEAATSEKTLEQSKEEGKNDGEERQEKSLQQQDRSKAADDSDIETDEEGVFSNSLSKENKAGKSDLKADEDDSETDEEGVFSIHTSTEIAKDRNAGENNTSTNVKADSNKESSSETDEEGVFSSYLSKDSESSVNKDDKSISRKSENKSINSETDEVGVFSNQSVRETPRRKASNNANKKTSGKIEDKDSDSETDEEGQFSLHAPKHQNSASESVGQDAKNQSLRENKSTSESSISKRVDVSHKKVVPSDLEDDMFEEDEDQEEDNEQQTKETSSKKSESKDDTASKVGNVSLCFKNVDRKSVSNKKEEDEKIDELAPTQVMNTVAFETKDDSIEPTQVISHDCVTPPRKRKSDAIDELARVQVARTRRSQDSSIDLESDFLSPTPIAPRRRRCQASVDEFELTPTQKIGPENSLSLRTRRPLVLVGDDIEMETTLKLADIELEPTQTMQADLEDDYVALTQTMPQRRSAVNELAKEDDDLELAPTQKLDTECPKDARRNTIHTVVTPVLARPATRLSLGSSKRQREKLGINASSKKVEQVGDRSLKPDFDSTVEFNLNRLFEGPEERQAPEEDSTLLTQQLENILESSQVEEISPKVHLSTLLPSPTLGSKRNQKRRRSCRVKEPLNKSSTSSRGEVSDASGESKEKSTDENDTIEKNLNELFDDSVNNVQALQALESDCMMTQQLRNILASQDDDQLEDEMSSADKKRHTVNLSESTPNSRSSKARLSITQRASDKSKSMIQEDKSKPGSLVSDASQKSQDDYFANLKSKRKNVIDMSSTDDEKDVVVYRRGMLGFTSDLVPVKSSSRIPFLLDKSRPFSDSQSEAEESLEFRSLNSGSRSSSKKRYSLSLKNVDLNGSMSSLYSEHEAEAKVKPQLSSSSVQQQKSSDPKQRSSSSSSVSGKRVREQSSSSSMKQVSGAAAGSSRSSPKTATATRTTKTTKTSTTATGARTPGHQSVARAGKKRPSADGQANVSSNHENRPPKCAESGAAKADIVERKDLAKLQKLSVLISPLRERFLTNKTAASRPSKNTDDNVKSDDVVVVVEQLSAAADSATATAAPARGKKVVKAPQILDSYVLLQKQNSRSELPGSLEEKNGSSSRSCKLDSKATQSRAAVAASTVKSTQSNANKDIEITDDSDDEVPGTQQTNTRSNRNVRNRSPDAKEVSKVPGEKDKPMRTRGGAKVAQKAPEKKVSLTLANKSKKEPIIIISDADVEIATSKTSKRVQSAKTKSSKISVDSESSTNKITRSTRAKAAVSTSHKKKSDSKELEKSEAPVKSKSARAPTTKSANSGKSIALSVVKKDTKNKKGIVIEETDTEKSDSELSEKSETPVKSRSTRARVAKNTNSSKSATLNANKKENTNKTSVTEKTNVEKPKSEQSKTSEIVSSYKSSRAAEAKGKASIKTDNVRTTTRQGGDLKRSDSADKSETQDNKLGKTLRSTRTRGTKNTDNEESEASAKVRSTRDKQVKPNSRYANGSSTTSVGSDGEDVIVEDKSAPKAKEVKSSCSTSKTSRKRAAPPELDKASLSAKPKKVTEVLKVEDTENKRSQRTRATKKDVAKAAEEKSVTQAKRAKLDNESEKETTTQKTPASRKRKSPSPTPSVRVSTRRRKVSAQTVTHKVMFSEEVSAAHRALVKKLGGAETEDFDDCSVLVTDKVQMTPDFLCSVAYGVPVVSTRWLIDSKVANAFIDLKDYILEDKAAEAKYKFKLKDSLKKAKSKKLLSGYTVLLAPHSQPSTAELKDMVIASGGKAILKAPSKWLSKTVVIANEENTSSAKKFMAKATKSVTVHSTDFLLIGILRQEINTKEFKLSL